ncbi:MAG: RluA family pseudouridine synthase [bacterium]|nr:RluA family pseudouridine synthase [bacterium]
MNSDFIVWQDDCLAVLNKPAGITVNPSETEKNITLVEMVTDAMKIPLERAGIVHRLDKDTSGVLIVAKNIEVLGNLQAQFKERVVQKTYLTLVHGHFDEKGGEIQAPISRNPFNREKFSVIDGGRESTTGFKVEGSYIMSMDKIENMTDGITKKNRAFFEKEAMEYSLLKVFPKTGRTHQIRVHMKYIHKPLVGDNTYTGKKLYRLDTKWCGRQFLHAFSIKFRHPITGEDKYFEVPLATDLQNALDFLKS